MKLYLSKLTLSCGVALFGFLLSIPAKAQIKPDNTLPINSSVDTPTCTICTITGGSAEGINLFHSFSEFSVPTGGEATFDNLLTIKNIFSRVTGDLESNIDGVIRTNNASLVLMNPNGIVFRENAELDINGSFLATSASSINFVDGTQFTTTPTQIPSLLTVTAPVGLGFGLSPGTITNRSTVLGNTLQGPAPVGLQVPTNETLGLIGGDIFVEGGFLTVEDGHIELGSLSDNSIVSVLTVSQNGALNGFQANYEEIHNFQDIDLSAAFLNLTGVRSSGLQIQGRQIGLADSTQIEAINVGAEAGGSLRILASESISFRDGATAVTAAFGDGAAGNIFLQAPNLTASDGGAVGSFTVGEIAVNSGAAGDIDVVISDTVELIGFGATGPSGFQTIVTPGTSGNSEGSGGTITIDARQLIVRGGAQVLASTFSTGNAGNITVENADLVEIEGTIPDSEFSSSLRAQSESGASGDGGTLTVNTHDLVVREGGQISTATFSSGRGGTLTVDASGSILLTGAGPLATLALGSSGLFASAEVGSTQDGGDLLVSAEELIVEDGAKISVDTFGTRQAGTATINIDRLIIREGGLVRGGSFNTGDGNTLIVNAEESIEISGTGSIGPDAVRSSLFTAAESDGNSGNLQVFSPKLNLQNGGLITARSSGRGVAGNIFLNITDELSVLGDLTNEFRSSDIRTDAQQSAGGAITITGDSAIRLIGDSDIRTNVASGIGNGGSILIEANALVALDDSDILAFAADGAGGNITLPAFFAQTFAPAAIGTDPATLDGNNRVDVNATGQIASGTITFPDVSFIENSLTELPDAPIDTDTLVASSCIAPTAQGSGRLVLTGADGIPQQPGRTGVASVPTGMVRTFLSNEETTAAVDEGSETWEIGDPISEPQSLYQIGNGRLVLSRDCS